MAHEIELKLALAEHAQRSFLRHPLLRKAEHKPTCRLVNLYYDTPRLELRERGIALRLRQEGAHWLQTVKCAGQAAGGLSVRPEWETPYGGHFDFQAIDDPQLRAWLDRPALRRRLAPIFETNFQRTTWLFAPAPGTRIALMLDRGWIAAAGRRATISEVEIELLEGDQARLFELARSLAERVALAPTPLSKAERGYRLFRELAAAPVKAAAIALTADESPLQAFRSIALSCIDHLQQNHTGALSSDDPEYIHQMRVATRRLRAALRLFAPQLPAGLADALVTPLRELMSVLGRARDFDVLLTEIAEPVLQSLPDEPRLALLIGLITERRSAIRHDAIRFLRSPRYGSIVLEVLAALHGLDADGGAKVGAGATAHSLGAFATDRLRRLRKKVLKLAARATTDDPASLHALRIGIKRLRYALDFFAPLAAPKALRRILDHLTLLQDTLGQINDLANAGQLLTACADERNSDPRLREAITLIGGWHGPRHQKLLAAVPDGLQHLGKLRLPKLRV